MSLTTGWGRGIPAPSRSGGTAADRLGYPILSRRTRIGVRGWTGTILHTELIRCSALGNLLRLALLIGLIAFLFVQFGGIH